MASKEDTAEREATVVRDHQAVNRRTLVDDMTVLMMIMMTTMMTVTIAVDKMSGMKRIAIAIMTDDDMTLALKATIAEEHADLESPAIRPTGLDTQDIDRGQVPLTEIHSRRPALIGQIHVPEHRDSLPVTTRDLTNILTTSSNTTQAEDTVNHPTVNNTINTHMSLTAPKDKHFTSTGSGRISLVGYSNQTGVGLTPVPNILGNRSTLTCPQCREEVTNYGFTAIRSPWACKLNPSTGENLLRENIS